MRTLLYTLIGAAAILSCLETASAAPSGKISTKELQRRLDEKQSITIIDVRSPSLYAQGHIPGAINIPASLCPQKNLPPLGGVVVYDDGLGKDEAAQAGADLAAKPGITVEILDGGLAAWENAHAATTRTRGLKPEATRSITYSELKRANHGDVLLVDLRKPPAPKQSNGNATPNATQPPLTDLGEEFPGMRVAHSAFGSAGAAKAGSASGGAPPLLVLIDNGDGAAQDTARKLRAGGVNRVVILVGGEQILARHGQAGLQRRNAMARPSTMMPASKPATP